VLDTRESSCLEHQAVGDREQPGPRVFSGREAVAMSPQAQEGLDGMSAASSADWPFSISQVVSSPRRATNVLLKSGGSGLVMTRRPA
jgi:hypothetical protein